MPKDNEFTIEFKKWYLGASPAAHLNSLTEIGGSDHYSTAQNIDILTPGLLTQGPALTDLTNGTQAGVVSELINFILDVAVASDTTFGIGNTKLFKISSTTVASGGTPSWPKTITGATAGKSVAYLKGVLYYFFNTATDSTIGTYDLTTNFNDAWQTGLIKSTLIPVATKEDIMLFGHGRYVGVYFASGTPAINKTKLDFGNNTEVADIIFNSNQWWIAVNSGITGTNRTTGQIYLYDGGALSSILSDETGVGVQRIGWLYPLNGIIYVAYQDLSYAGGYTIGYIAGRQIKPLAYFTGSLPTYAQKTLYKNTILFLSSGLVYSVGAVIPDLPIQISQLADGGYSTCGALAAPFGVPFIASTDSGSNFRLAYFSGYDTACNWKSIVIPLVEGRLKGMIDEVVVLTKTLGDNAKCLLQLEYNQNSSNSGTAKQITGAGKRRHIFNGFGSSCEDFRIYLNFASGNATNDCAIRSIKVKGHWCEN